MQRSSGVLMHVSSLFGKYSVGSFGEEAKYFIDFLHEAGFSYWQVLPFCMTDDCNSPYKSYSAFGANPLFIDLQTLCDQGLLTSEELVSAEQKAPYLCEYERLSEQRLPLLSLAATRVSDRDEVKKFIVARPELSNAAEFLALREANGNKPWQEWQISRPDSERLFVWQFIQYEFYRQWKIIKTYANERGIKIIGDVPMYVAEDSADVWAHREQFLLDSDGYPKRVAGVPPDYFSADGQLWGNPLYNYKKMLEDGYLWWRSRIRYMLELFDGVRIDHFRGFESFWSIPAGEQSARSGKWVKGPGRQIVNAIKEEAAGRLIIAEDLGDITPAVAKLLSNSGLPGMRVFQFAFLGDPSTPHLPHNYNHNSVAYTGTHDNNTLLGYVWEMPAETRRHVFDYCGYGGENFTEGTREIVRTVMQSHADVAIVPIQDLLGYGSDTRMNTPGRAEGNWAYRVTKEQLDSLDRNVLLAQNRLYGRKM